MLSFLNHVESSRYCPQLLFAKLIMWIELKNDRDTTSIYANFLESMSFNQISHLVVIFNSWPSPIFC